MRSKALGIATTPKPAVSSPKKSADKENKKTEPNVRVTELTKKSFSSPRKSANGKEIVRANSKTPTTRTVSNKSSDNSDVNVEINITSNQHVQVS